MLNKPGFPLTFRNCSGGESNIDVTFATANICDFVVGWCVLDAATNSDHNVIMFNIELNEVRNTGNACTDNVKYNLRNMDWNSSKAS